MKEETINYTQETQINYSNKDHYHHHNKQKKEKSEDTSFTQTIQNKPTPGEQMKFLFPTISVQIIGDVLSKAENNINRGIELLKLINDQESSKLNENSLISANKKSRKRNYLSSIESNKDDSSSVLSNLPIVENKTIKKESDISKNSIINTEQTIRPEELSCQNLLQLPQIELEIDQIINELGKLSSKNNIKLFLINKYPLLNEYSSLITKISDSNNTINHLQKKLTYLIESNQNLKKGISSDYIEYAKLKDHNEQYKMKENNVIQKIKEYQTDINHLEDVLETERLKANTLHEKLKVVYQSESILSFESPTEEQGF